MTDATEHRACGDAGVTGHATPDHAAIQGLSALPRLVEAPTSPGAGAAPHTRLVQEGAQK